MDKNAAIIHSAIYTYVFLLYAFAFFVWTTDSFFNLILKMINGVIAITALCEILNIYHDFPEFSPVTVSITIGLYSALLSKVFSKSTNMMHFAISFMTFLCTAFCIVRLFI